MRISDWSSDVCSSDLEYGPSRRRRRSTRYSPRRRPAPASAAPAESGRAADPRGAGIPDPGRRDGRRDARSAGSTSRGWRLRLLRGRGRIRASAERSEEHTSELQSLMRISYAVLFLHIKNKLSTTLTHVFQLI